MRQSLLSIAAWMTLLIAPLGATAGQSSNNDTTGNSSSAAASSSRTINQDFIGFYPIPYAKYNEVNTNGLKVLGGIYNMSNPRASISSINELNKVNLHRGIVIGTLMPEVYGRLMVDGKSHTELYQSLNSWSYPKLTVADHKILFNHNSYGIFAHGPNSGLVHSRAGNGDLQLRHNGPIHLQPQFTQSPGHYKHLDQTVATAGLVEVQGNLQIRGVSSSVVPPRLYFRYLPTISDLLVPGSSVFYDTNNLFPGYSRVLLSRETYNTMIDAGFLSLAGQMLTYRFQGSLDRQGASTGSLKVVNSTNQELFALSSTYFDGQSALFWQAPNYRNMFHGYRAPMHKAVLATMGNIYVEKRLKFRGHLAVPTGTIIMYAGSTIPQGWAICNGSIVNGFPTPNLVGRFIMAARTLSASPVLGGGAVHHHDYQPTFLNWDASQNQWVTRPSLMINIGHSHNFGNHGLLDLETSPVLGAHQILNGVYNSNNYVTGLFFVPRMASTGMYQAIMSNSHYSLSGQSVNHDGYTPFYSLLRNGWHSQVAMDHYHHVNNRTVGFELPYANASSSVNFLNNPTSDAQWEVPRADVVFIVRLPDA